MTILSVVLLAIFVSMNSQSVFAMNNNNNANRYHNVEQGPLVPVNENNKYTVDVLAPFYAAVNSDNVAEMNAILKHEIMDKNSSRMLEVLRDAKNSGHLLFLYRYNRYLHGILSSQERIFKKRHFNEMLETIVFSHIRSKQDIDCCGLFRDQEITALAENGSKVLVKKFLSLWRPKIEEYIQKKCVPNYKEMLGNIEEYLQGLDYESLFPEDICSIKFAGWISATLAFATPSVQMRQRFDTLRDSFRETALKAGMRELEVLKKLGSWENFLAMYTKLAA